VLANWTALTPRLFLEQYLRCVGSIQKKYATHELHFPAQMRLFRECSAAKIARDAELIWAEWQSEKCDLNGRMVKAVIDTARRVAEGWRSFKEEFLPLPDHPQAEEMDAWWPAYYALDRLPMVGDAIAWYLIRNLYGAPFLKPDLHIKAIAAHFFGAGGVEEMAALTRRLWPEICREPRLLPVHLAEGDYFLWWYRQATGEPAGIGQR